MINKVKESRGITLIALVITIIVLLILAGVAISMLAGDNGILRQAAEAKAKTNQASIEEQIKLAVMTAIDTDGNIDTKVLSEELNKIDKGDRTITELPCTVKIDGIEQVIEKNGEVHEPVTIENLKKSQKPVNKKTVITFGEEQITIPEGFKIAEDSAEDIKDGIVVIAPDESEFVWVPVKNASTMYENKTVTQVDGTQKEIKVGKLYNNGDINSPITWSDTGYREPAILKNTTFGDAVPESTDATKGIGLLKSIVKLEGTTDNEILEKWEKQLQDEFDEMIRSVETNKGFYVGRYECSLTEDKTKIQSKKNKISAIAEAHSCNTWYGLYQKNKEYSLKNEKLKDVVGSSMIWGSQYDQMMIWMKANGYDVTSTTPKTGVAYNNSKTTGKENDPDVLNNVYDLLGCNYEGILEADNTYRRVYRRRLLHRRRFSFVPWKHRSV